MPKITPLHEIIERQYDKRLLIFAISSGCAGCGGGIVAQALARALDRIGISHDSLVIVQGITCSGSQVGALSCNLVGSLHGRALPMATGLKLIRPELTVLVIQGDGDAVAIGGNHFIHAARRNVDVTTIVNNNFTYGRTGGQHGPTTPEGALAPSAPFGTIEPPFDVCRLAEAAGATFVARGTTYHAIELINTLEKAIRHRGFSVVEVITQCPSSFGRRNPGLTGGTAPEMMKWMRDNTASIESAREMSDDQLKDKIIRGIFVDRETPGYGDKYQHIIRMAQQGGWREND